MAAKKKQTDKSTGPSAESLKAVKLAMDKIDKDFGKGTVMMLDEKPAFIGNVISTGSLGVDIALGVGGLPKGRVVEMYGPESSGKTTLAMHVIAEAQKLGGLCAIIDAEHAFDAAYARALGINTKNLIISQPDYGEQGLEVLDRLIDTGGMAVILVDSVSALVPKSELEGEMGDSKMGLHARLMSQALRKITGKVSKTNTIVIFINQLREKIGIMFGNPETTTGGNALKFYASIRIDIRKTGVVKDGDVVIANEVKVKIIKNKVAPPFRAANLQLRYGIGFDKYAELVAAATAMNVIEKNGSWYSYKQDKLGQGAETIRQLFIDNEPLFDEIYAEVKSKIFENQ